MSRKRKARRNAPRDPAVAEQRQRERADIKAETARLKALGVEVNHDKYTGQIVGAYRPDVVTLMKGAGKISQEEADAVRNLEALIERANGPSPSSLSSLDRVSGGVPADPIRAKVDAARQLARRQEAMDALTWALLRQLCDGNLLTTRWRQRVEMLTGETNPDAQSGVVRQAFRVLAGVEERLAREGRRAA